MAKGNLLLGTAGNSVGDVVMYRREGAQVSRVRVRKVKNPKTAAQSTQRAFFAPVAKFYSPLSIVLERSYEGLSKSKSYSNFLKTNVDLARANDWLLPKGTGFFPLPYKLSSGSLPSLTYGMSGNYGELNVGTSAADINTVGQLSTALINLGYKAADIISFIFVIKDTASNYVPHTCQFEINTTSSVTLTSLLGTCGMEAAPAQGNSLNFAAKTGSCVAIGVIAARYQNDVWRRSNQILAVDATIISTISASEYKAAAIASYGATNTGDNPLVYLDGKELEG